MEDIAQNITADVVRSHEPIDAGRVGPHDPLDTITSHVFRTTCATILDTVGQSARAVADQLGHAQVSMTQNHDLGRRVANHGAADALDAWNDGTENHG